MAKKQSGIHEDPSLDIQSPLYSENADGVGGEQTDFTSGSYVGASYVGSADSGNETVGSYVGASYVGADRVVSAANRKKGNFRKTLMVSVIAVVVLIALVAFVIWPLLIYPNMANADLYTPEILQSYCATKGNKDTILTFTGCSADGQVTAIWEFIEDEQYGKINLVGQITEKKNNGDLVIDWISNTVEILPSGFSWGDEQSASVSKNFTVVKTDEQELTAGVNEEYSIKTAADFAKLSGSGGTFFLKNDIDFAGQEWTPITGFSGMLMGNGYTIKNLTINASSSNVGLFATLEGRVQNLKFENAQITVTGSQENVGILCGTLKGDATDITVSGKITASSSSNVGGIAGWFEAKGDTTILNLKNEAEVNGANLTGGIFGKATNSNGYYSYVMQLSGLTNSGKVSGKNRVGGIVGDCTTGTMLVVSDCANSGDVAGGQYVGGIVGCAQGYTSNGKAESFIQNSSCAAAIKGEAYVGCIAGMAKNITINSCTNAGSTLTATKYVTEGGGKNAYVGGFAGYAYGVNECTNEVEINYTAGGAGVGGIAGWIEAAGNATFSGLANNANISGANLTGGIFGKVTNSSGYYSYVLQLSGMTNNGKVSGKSHVGGIVGNCTTGTMLVMSDCANTGDVTGEQCVGGVAGYAQGYTSTGKAESFIQNSSCAAAIKGEAYVGCIAGLAKNITINACTNAGSTLTATKYLTENGSKYAYVGGFAGYAYGANECTNEVEINYTAGGSSVGGIVGWIEAAGNATFSDLANNANISGANATGGIFGKVTNGSNYYSYIIAFAGCTNSGSVNGDNNVGGIIGYIKAGTQLQALDFVNSGVVSGSENVGGVIGYANCYKGSYIQDASTTSGALCGKLVDVTVK